MEQIPRYTGSPDAFPASEELPAGAKTVCFTPREGYLVDYRPNIIYDERDGETLHLQLFLPTDDIAPCLLSQKRYPLIVYIPGSAWMRQNVHIALQRMVRVCERGYAVAVVQYRPSEVAAFPAQIEDAKTAIRFMRKNAGAYRLDPDRVAVWGDSSGGHTAVSVGITGDGSLDNGAYNEFSCKVSCVVDWFGPTDISVMNFYPGVMDHAAPDSPVGLLLGGVDVLENPQLAQKVNPAYYLTAETNVPPTLIIHGDRDSIVPFNQSVRLYDKLRELGKSVTLYKLESSGHGSGGFNSDGVIDLTLDFIVQHIGKA